MADELLEFVRGTEAIPRDPRWLWPDWMQKGTLTMLAGMSDTGKSCLSLDLAARITTGAPWPDEKSDAKRGNVLVISSEDDFDETIVPRFLNHDGDPKRLYYLPADDLSLRNESSLDDLQGYVNRKRISLMIFDPLSDVMLESDIKQEESARKALRTLRQLCKTTGASALTVKHPIKDTERPDHFSISGSYAFQSVPRSVLKTVLRSGDLEQHHWVGSNRFALYCVKQSNARRPAALAYDIESGDAWSQHPKLRWLGGDELTNEALEEASSKIIENGHQDAGDQIWLRQVIDLSEGRMQVREAKSLAKERGMSERRVQKAAKGLGVEEEREGNKQGKRGLQAVYYVRPDDGWQE